MATGYQSFSRGSDEIHNHDCDVCLSNHKTLEAISYCTICCEYLCQSCDLSHRGSKASRDHTILTGSNVRSGSTRTKPTLPFMFCDTHKNTLLNIYCTTHDEVICQACKMNSHRTCDTGDVSRHSAQLDVERELKKVAKGLRDLTTRYEDITKIRQIDKSTVKTQLQKCLSNIRQFRNDINDKLDKTEKKISSEIRCFEETMKKEIDVHVILADDILRQIGDLDKSLSSCQKTLENDVMFVGMKKAASRANEYGYILRNVQEDIYPIDICFQPNDVLTGIIQQLHSLGTVANRLSYTGLNQTSILNTSVKNKQELDVKSDSVIGCTLTSDGHLVLACKYVGLKLFDKNFQFKSLSSVYVEDVSAINDSDVIVTQYDRKQLKRVRLFPDTCIVVKKTLKMDIYCWGLDVYGDEIYVTCHDGPVEVQRRLGVDNGTYIFTGPDNVKVNRDGSKVFLSDWNTNTVTCLNNKGHVIYQYYDGDLKRPTGMYVDGKDNM